MIKRLLFDIDNTLIEWKKEYDATLYAKTFEEEHIKYDKEIIKEIAKVINNYEKENLYFSEEKMIEDINKKLNKNFAIKLLKTLLDNTIKYATPEKIDESKINTLELLSKKYEMVLVTNWFEKYQIKRMEKCGLMHYFSKIYATEKYKVKPNIEIFNAAIEGLKPNECIMIGDNYEVDIQGANKANIKAIWITNSNKQVDENKCIKIRELSQLQEIL